MKEIFKRHTLIIYVFATYFFSWAFLYPCYRILLNAPDGKFPWLALIGLPGAYGPSLVALLMTRGRNRLSIWLTMSVPQTASPTPVQVSPIASNQMLTDPHTRGAPKGTKARTTVIIPSNTGARTPAAQ